eukprot:11905809-Karenia_brevis.AAC.1
MRNGKYCCAGFATVRKEALGRCHDNDDKVLAENRDLTEKLLVKKHPHQFLVELLARCVTWRQ